MRVTALVLALFVGPGLLLSLGCGSQPTGPVMQPGRPIPGLNLTGKWYSREFGDMRLVHSKNVVTGTYQDPRGPDHNGRVRGRINADLLELEWIKPGNPLAAIMPMRGSARLRITDNGCTLDGLWGYDKTWHGGGTWNATKSQFAVGGEHCVRQKATRPEATPADVPIDGTTEEALRDTPALEAPVPEGAAPGDAPPGLDPPDLVE